MSAKISVLTFNLRVINESDGINVFHNRKQRIMETIETINPDLIGFQEVNDKMKEWVKAVLSDKYETVGCGRNDDYKGECVLTAFKKNTFEAISYETFWLSSTPSVSGSKYLGTDQSRCPRICTVVDLKHIEAAEVFSFYNTHLDHVGSVARLLGAMQIMQRISLSDKHFILTGDMNALPQTPEINAFTTAIGDRNIKDLTEDIYGTFHKFGTVNPPKKIDYIFTDLLAEKSDCRKIEDNGVEGLYISDHNPVYAEVTVD